MGRPTSFVARAATVIGSLALSVTLGACSSASTGAPSSGSSPASSGQEPSASAQASAGSFAAVTSSNPPASTSTSSGPFLITSTGFAENQPIPAEFTCHGADRSPPLAWSGVPGGAKALVLFVDDPDGHNWVHWSVLDLDSTGNGLPAAVPPSADQPQQGRNDFGKLGYGGPCPPSGTHHYHFTLYALGAPLGLDGHPDGAAVRNALASAQVLARATLVGTSKA